ncbi:MAG: hypothetical protein IRZ16_13280 [Myxococcaceae bacterium]|nr:hypothetical protein [Myxococcaceae bacterium]
MERRIEEELSEDIRVEAPPPPPSPEELLAAQFKGRKADLRPLYDGLVHIARRLYPRVRCEPLPNVVRFVARQPFAVFRATSAVRADLGLCLGPVSARGRLRPCKGLGGVDGVTHRIELYGPGDLDADLVRWMKRAIETRS